MIANMVLAVQRKVQCVLWLAKFESIVRVQRQYRRVYGVNPPDQIQIRRWDKKLKETGSLLRAPNPGRPSVSVETAEAIGEVYARSPSTSTRSVAQRLGNVSHMTVNRVARKRLGLKPYKLQLLHKIEPQDKPRRFNFAVAMLYEIDRDPTFLNNIVFSDECIFRVSGHVHRHNVRIWASENRHILVHKDRNSKKVMVWCGMAHDRIIGPFFFHEPTIDSFNYRDMLEQYAMPQIVGEGNETAMFQQDGAPPHYANIVRDYLDETLPGKWIGRGAPNGWRAWPARSPDLTPLDFFLRGYVKDMVYKVKITSVEHLKRRVTDAIQSIPPDMIGRVWNEIEYRLDLCRATNGSHIELH